MNVVFLILLTVFEPASGEPPTIDRRAQTVEAASDGEGSLTLMAGCTGCDWGVAGREATVLRLTIDGRYFQHIILTRGETPAEYRVSLGSLAAGRHQVTIERDVGLSARGAGRASIDIAEVHLLVAGKSTDHRAQSLAPIVYARPDTLGRFTDVPLVMWYEVVPTERGQQYRYSVIFSNEDGGTPTDRLMATWGRATDIEYVYGVEVDGAGRVLAEEFQASGHTVSPFHGRREGTHPLLWIATDNNMVSETGTTTVRFGLVPTRIDLADQAREIVMDRNAWTFAVMAKELEREGKAFDPRRFVYVDACAAIGQSAMAVEIAVADRWIRSDLGMPTHRVVRDGCVRVATQLPPGTGADDIRAVRVLALERPQKNGEPPPPLQSVTLTRINSLFVLDDQYVPRPSLLQWIGPASIASGERFEIRVR